MEHLHFDNIKSTQDFLKEKILKEPGQFLISCEAQTHGYGQYGREWKNYSNNLCFSFTYAAVEQAQLTSLEVGVLLCQYFQKLYNIELQLKWPNDLLNKHGQKCGGIIIYSSGKELIVGIGLNYNQGEIDDHNFKTPFGSILDTNNPIDKKRESFKIYNYLQKNRITFKKILSSWEKYCGHINKEIIVHEKEQEYNAIFLGVGEQGEAIIQYNQNKIKKLFSASISLTT